MLEGECDVAVSPTLTLSQAATRRKATRRLIGNKIVLVRMAASRTTADKKWRAERLRWRPRVSLNVFIPSLDYRVPEKDFIICNPILYADSNIPMCDLENRRRDVIEYDVGIFKYGLLFRPHLCMFVFKKCAFPLQSGGDFPFQQVPDEESTRTSHFWREIRVC